MAKYKNDPKAKRYFWLKLKNDFFEQKEIKLLRRIAGGDTYTIIYLKMMLKSLKNDGKLFYEFYGDNFAEEIALDIDESSEDVAMTVSYLESKGLIELVEQDEYFLNKVPEMLGSESYSAERMRNFRERKTSQCDTKSLQSDNNVSLSDEEIEKEIEKEIEIDIKPVKDDLKERFELLWKPYPNKKGKDGAFKAYKRAIKDGVTDEAILSGIERYKQEIIIKQTDPQFIQYGSTWFNGKRWEDDYITTDTKQSNQPREQDWSVPEQNQFNVDGLPDSMLDDLPF